MKIKSFFLICICIFLLEATISCRKDKKLLKCPDGYDCITDTVHLPWMLPCPIYDTIPNPPFPVRIDDDSTYIYWFPDTSGCGMSIGYRPYIDFSTRTFLGIASANSDSYTYTGTNICISNGEKKVIFTTVFKHPTHYVGMSGNFILFYTVPKIPSDYTIEYVRKKY